MKYIIFSSNIIFIINIIFQYTILIIVSPNLYGEYVYNVALISVFLAFYNFNIQDVLVRYRNMSIIENVYHILKIEILILLSLAIVIYYFYIINYSDLLKITFVTLILIKSFNILNKFNITLFNINDNYKLTEVIAIKSKIISICIGLLLINFIHIYALFVYQLSEVILTYYFLSKNTFIYKKSSYERNKILITVKYAKKRYYTRVIGELIEHVDKLLINTLFNSTILAYYDRSRFISNSVIQVFNKVSTRYYFIKFSKFKTTEIVKTLNTYIYLVLIISIIFIFIMPFLLSLIFRDSSWLNLTDIVPYFSLLIFSNIVVTLIRQIIYSKYNASKILISRIFELFTFGFLYFFTVKEIGNYISILNFSVIFGGVYLLYYLRNIDRIYSNSLMIKLIFSYLILVLLIFKGSVI